MRIAPSKLYGYGRILYLFPEIAVTALIFLGAVIACHKTHAIVLAHSGPFLILLPCLKHKSDSSPITAQDTIQNPNLSI